MADTFYRTGPSKKMSSEFGGIIYPSDFNTEFRGRNNPDGSSIAKRIVNDQKFDRQCRTNGENRNRKKFNFH